MSEVLTQDNVKVGVKIRCMDKEGYIEGNRTKHSFYKKHFSDEKVYEITDLPRCSITDGEGCTLVFSDEFKYFEVVDEEYSTESPLPTDNTNEWTDKHYDMMYKLTEDDIKAGEINMEPYFVAMVWKTGSRDNSGALIHQLKTIARFGDKNDIEREIKALYKQAKAMARVYKVNVDE